MLWILKKVIGIPKKILGIPKKILRIPRKTVGIPDKIPGKYFKTLNNRPWGADNESLGGPGGPGTGFCSPGDGFSGSRPSGKPLRLLRLKQTPPGLQKTVPGPPGPPRDSLLAPQGRLLSVLKYLPKWGCQLFWFFGHNSCMISRIWTRLGENISQESPAAF